MTALQQFLIALVRSSGRTQADIAAEVGFSEKHVSFLMTGKQEGSLTAWQRLLDAAGIELGEEADQ